MAEQAFNPDAAADAEFAAAVQKYRADHPDLTQEEAEQAVREYMAGVQVHKNEQAALGNDLTWEEAERQFRNLLANQAADPEATDKATHPEDRLAAIERMLDEHEARIAYLEDVQGGTVVASNALPQ